MTWMSIEQQAAKLLWDAACQPIETHERIFAEHEFTEHHAGDGYTEPRETWIACSCGVTVWAWQQYYMEVDEDPETAKKLHLAFALCEEIIKRDKEQKDGQDQQQDTHNHRV